MNNKKVISLFVLSFILPLLLAFVLLQSNWLPQQRSDPPPKAAAVSEDLTMEEYVEMGRVIVFGAKQVAANAQDLHWTNAVLGAAAIERAADAQAVFFAVDFELGVASEEAADRAFQEARRNAGQTALLAATAEVDVVTVGVENDDGQRRAGKESLEQDACRVGLAGTGTGAQQSDSTISH